MFRLDPPTPPRVHDFNEHAMALCRFVVRASSALSVVVGTLAVTEWLLDVTRLRTIQPGWVAMPPTAAVALIFAGGALAFSDTSDVAGMAIRRKRRWISRTCAAVLALIGGIGVAEYLVGAEFGVMHLSLEAARGGAAAPLFGQMSMVVAADFALLGVSLGLVANRRLIWAANGLCLASGLMALVALLGYLYDVRALYDVGPFSGTSAPSALMLFILACAALCVRPRDGVMALVTTNSAGGTVLRWLLVPAVAVPILLHGLDERGVRAGWHSAPFGSMVAAALTVFLIALLVWSAALAVHERDTRRLAAEATLSRSEERHRLMFQRSPLPMWVYDVETLRFLAVNGAAVQRYGYSEGEFLAMTIRDIRPPEDLARLEHGLQGGAIEKGNVGTWRHRTKNGEIIDVDVSASSIEFDHRNARLILAQDVTARAQAEQAIRASELRLRTIVENEPECVVTVSIDGRLVEINPAGLQILEAEAGTVVGRELAGMVHPHDRQTYLHLHEQATRGGSGLAQFRVIGLHGTERWVDAHSVPLRAGDGSVTAVLSVARDISATRLAEQGLRYQAAVLDSVSEAIIAADARHQITVWNKAAESLYGWSKAEALGRNGVELVRTEWPGIDAERMRRTMTKRGSWRGEAIQRHRTGAPIPVDLSTIVLRDEHGSVFAYVSANRDITERKRSEAALRLQSAALNAAESAILITDVNGTIQSANQAFLRDTGHTLEEVLGKNPRELVKSGVHDRSFYGGLWTTILGGSTWQGDMTNRRKDGSLYPMELTITPVKDASGEITHFIAIERDLTERKRLEAQYLHAQKMESVGQFAGGIAHDFNNILTVIIGTASLAMESLEPGDELLADLQEIDRAGERAAALTRQLLAFSRKQILLLEVLNINTIVAGVQKMLERLVREDIHFAVKLAPGLGNVRIDLGQMEQVLMNLVVNARDAMPNGGSLIIETRTVTLDHANVAAQPSVPPGSHIMLAVSDTGIGMDAATQARIFEPFFTTKGTGQGTGLGLSTVYGIVKQCGGSIAVDSEPGRGTTFRLYLPQVEGDVRATDQGRELRDVRGTETILTVEDDSALRQLAVRILKSVGYTVLVADNGTAALDLLEHHHGPVHLMLTDVVLPGMNGRELAGRAVSARAGIRVLFTSGYTDDVLLQHEVLDGVTHFIHKPYTRAVLTHKVRELLDS